MFFLFLGLGIFCICVIISALILLLSGDGSRDQKLMQYFLLGSLVQNTGYLLELTAPTAEAAIVATKMQYLGSLAVPISYCYFIFSYCFEKIPEKIFLILRIADVFVLGLVFTCDFHPFYYRQIEWLQTVDGHGYLRLDYGPGYWLFMLCGTAMPYVLSQGALIRVCIKKPEYEKDRKYRLILLLSCFPVVALCSYSLKLAYVYDPTPVVLGLTLSCVIILIWSRKVYDFSSLASGILLDNMSDGMIALDEQRRIVNYNPAAADIFPELPRTVGKHMEELADFPQDILGEDVNAEFSLNDHFYQGHVKQIIDRFGQNKGYVVLILDVTETRNYIEEIKRVREEAEQANIAKSAFLANMSHEIRTPMNAIVGLSDVIMEESRGRKVYEYACDIKSSSRNLLALINDILDLSKVEADKMELTLASYHVKAMGDEVLNMMEMVASKRGISLKSEYDPSIPCRYLGDEGRIKQILINLLNNALKFTKEGHVKLSVTGEQGSAADIEWLYFKVEDTGCGIHKEDLGKIFENFRQVDSKRNRSIEGTGLGLSITKRLVELMEGTIQVNSVYGEGTIFIVGIPQKIVDYSPLSETPVDAAGKEETMEPFTAKGYKVLNVDDNPTNRKIVKIFLQPYGFDLSEADSGQEAIRLVREARYDMIFMDHMMPGMDGIETVKILREECGENGRYPTIIALTANAMEGVRENFLSNGFQDFLTKPLERNVLHEMLLKWIPADRRTAGQATPGSVQPDNRSSQEFRNIRDIRNIQNIKNIKIEGIDTGAVVQRYSGSVQEYKELLDLYCLDGKRKLALLRNLWENQDYGTYGIETHGLKSASANIGAMELSKSAREHEMAVARGDIAFVDSHVAQLLADYGEQIGHIRSFLANSQQTDGAGKNQAGSQKETLKEISSKATKETLKETSNKATSNKTAKETSEETSNKVTMETSNKAALEPSVETLNKAALEPSVETSNKAALEPSVEALNKAALEASVETSNKAALEANYEIEKAALKQGLDDALGRLENFRAKECAHKIKKLLTYRLPADTEASLMEIQDLLKLYEDDAAEQMLRDLIAQIEKGEQANG